MASPGGTSSGSSSLHLDDVMDERKRKRMESNRESARRSRMRKQKHLDELMAQVAHLRKSNTQLLDTINITTQHYAKIEAQNSVLRAQMSELTSRLQSLNEITNVLAVNSHHNDSNGLGVYQGGDKIEDFLPILQDPFAVDSFLMMNNAWSSTANSFNQPIMASAAANNMFQY